MAKRFFQVIAVVEILVSFVVGVTKKCPENNYFDSVTSNCHSCKDCCPPRPKNEFCSKECDLVKVCDAPVPPTTATFIPPVTTTLPRLDNKAIVAIALVVLLLLLVIVVLVYWFYFRKKCRRACPNTPCQQADSGRPDVLCISKIDSQTLPNSQPGTAMEQKPFLNGTPSNQRILYERKGGLHGVGDAHHILLPLSLVDRCSSKKPSPDFKSMPVKSPSSPSLLEFKGRSFRLVEVPPSGGTETEHFSMPTPCSEDLNKGNEGMEVETDVKKPLDYSFIFNPKF